MWGEGTAVLSTQSLVTGSPLSIHHHSSVSKQQLVTLCGQRTSEAEGSRQVSKAWSRCSAIWEQAHLRTHRVPTPPHSFSGPATWLVLCCGKGGRLPSTLCEASLIFSPMNGILTARSEGCHDNRTGFCQELLRRPGAQSPVNNGSSTSCSVH